MLLMSSILNPRKPASRSHVDIKEARKSLYAAIIDGRTAVKLGTRDWNPGHGWHLALDGERFAVWVRSKS